MKHIIPLILLATPGLAHEGAHMHPHSIEGWVAGLALLGVVVVVLATIRARK